MLNKLGNIINRTLYSVSAFSLRHTIRAKRRKTYNQRKKDMEPLTKTELRSINRIDIPDYTLFKYMGGADNLSYYVPIARYITKILPVLNPENHSPSGASKDNMFSDKNYAQLYMSGFNFPNTPFRRINGQFYDSAMHRISREDVLKLASNYDELVFKQSVGSSHGKGVRLIQAEGFENAIDSYGKDYLAQERIFQHENLAYFNESSVNIVRITSLFWNGTVYLLSGILRIGAPGSFCDHTPHGGIHNLDIALNDDGTFHNTAFDPDHCLIYDNVYGKEIRGFIPNYETMKKLVVQEHSKYPYYGIIGWDLTVDRNGDIICVEYNSKFPGIFASQYACGPIFAQKSKDGRPLLDEIRAKYPSVK